MRREQCWTLFQSLMEFVEYCVNAVMFVLLLASAIVHVEPATAAERVIYAIIVVHVLSSAHTCKMLKLALKELHQQLMNQALVNQRKVPQNQNIHSKITCG